VHNTKKTPINITILEPIPLSNDDKLKVSDFDIRFRVDSMLDLLDRSPYLNLR